MLAQVDRSELRQGEVLSFSVTIAGPLHRTPRLEMASFEGFRVVSTGQSQEIQMKERRMMQTLTLSYVLTPVAVGTHTLGPVKVEVQGRVYQTQPIEVRVLSGEAPKAERRRGPRLKGGVTL